MQINSIGSDIPAPILASFQLKEYLQILKFKIELNIKDEQIPKIIRNSFSSQISYLRELKRREQSTSKVKLMILSDLEVEKKLFIQHILGAKFGNGQIVGYDFSSKEINPRIEITEGVDVHLHQPQDKDFTMSIYDFSVQDIDISTYSFVLSSHAIYLLLFDASKSLDHNRIAHWLHILSSCAPGASVFLVATHFSNPSALHNVSTSLSQLQAILENVQYIARDAVRIITPNIATSIDPSIILSNNFRKLLSSVNIDINQLSIWPITIPAPADSSASMISKLIQAVTLIAEKDRKKTPKIPKSWNSFRSVLYVPRRPNYNNIKNSNIYKLYAEGSFKIGIMKETDIMMYGYQIYGISKHEIEEFLEILEYWGHIKTLRSSSSSSKSNNQNLIILKPELLISLYKLCLPSKKSNLSQSMMITLKKLFTTNNENDNFPPHLLNTACLQKNVHTLIPQLSNDDIQNIVDQYVIPVFVELRLIYPIVFPPNTYIIPALLRGLPSLPNLLSFSNHPLFSKQYNCKIDIIIMERRYEFIYLPDVMFTSFIMEICKYFSVIPYFKDNLHDPRLFWENGFIITDHLSLNNNFEYDKYQMCIIQSISNNSKGSNGYGRSILVKVSSPISKVGVILPIIHRAIMNVVIQPLEFDIGRYQSQIFCSAMTPSNRITPPQQYEYYSCFQAISLFSSPENKDAIKELPLLIPEYYNVVFENQMVIEKTIDYNRVVSSSYEKYKTEIQEIQLLGEGIRGEEWYGYLHNHHEVAIKKPNYNQIPAILTEFHILRTFNHPTLLKLFGVYFLPTSLAVVTEYCKERDLMLTIKNQPGMHPIIVCSIVRDIAEGLSYLHNHSPPIIHRDIRPSNIYIKSLKLCKDQVCAVIGDFGYIRVVDPHTLSSGTTSARDDISGFSHIITLLVDCLLNSSPPESKDENYIGGEVDELRTKVITKLKHILMSLAEYNFDIDTQHIAESLSTEIIIPFYYNEHYHDSIDRKYKFEYHVSTILSQNTLFPHYQKLVHQIKSPQIAESLLHNCISLLRSDSNAKKSPEYWYAICRYVIPVIGSAIEYHVFTMNHMNQLVEIEYYDDPQGDYENGLTLFHYACISANYRLLETLCLKPCSDINQRTYLPSGSAAIHFAISSQKHHSNTKGIKATIRVLDFLIRSHRANINQRDNKGETVLFKAAMEGSFQLVVHLLNYEQPVDVHILSNQRITAIVGAARYAPRTEEAKFCIKTLLQMGSEYSRSLRKVISTDELKRIREVATELINDQSFTFAHSIFAIQSWLSNDNLFNVSRSPSYHSNISQTTNSDTPQQNSSSHIGGGNGDDYKSFRNNNSDTSSYVMNGNVHRSLDNSSEQQLMRDREIEVLRDKLSSIHSKIGLFFTSIYI